MISAAVKRALWAESAGYCANPDCHEDLIRLFENQSISSIDELAHIIAQSSAGPRGAGSAEGDRDAFDNILVLCPTCHTLIDKNPDSYPPQLLRKWKHAHRTAIRAIFGKTFENRELLREHLQNILRRNKALFDQYGPLSTAASNPLSDSAKMWRRVVVSDLLPNNREIIQSLSHNQKLLTPKDLEVVEAFRMHAEAFEFNHLSGDKFAEAPMFPKDIYMILH
jgi:hypothetical protein